MLLSQLSRRFALAALPALVGFGAMASSHPSKAASDAESVPGDSMSVKTTLLDKGAGVIQGVMQNLQPVKKIHMHLCAFHLYAHDLTRQVEAHHFCSHLNEDIQQCVIYDTDESNARLIGVEYVIKEEIFATLPPEEKKLWHSHEYEVKSGELVLPGLPKVAEQAVLRKLAKTYGKTWHFWQYDRGDQLPLGLPQLMAAVTHDGQLDLKVVEERDRRYGVSTADRKKERQDIEGPAKIDPDADYPHRTGKGLQVVLMPEEELQLPRHL